MFDWLIQEMSEVKDRRFFVCDGPPSAEDRRGIEDSPLKVPASYKEFVLRFGHAHLYRTGSQYHVQVYGAPRAIIDKNGEEFLNFGRTSTALAYFKTDLWVGDGESPVFEWRHPLAMKKAADGFTNWLESRCQSARKRYGKKQWKEIQEGPVSFTPREEAIVEARHLFRWRVVKVHDDSNIDFEITNGSRLVLPYITIVVKGKGGSLFRGALWIPTSSIFPGETKVIRKTGYRDIIDPHEVDFLDPLPLLPEDRKNRWEFK